MEKWGDMYKTEDAYMKDRRTREEVGTKYTLTPDERVFVQRHVLFQTLLLFSDAPPLSSCPQLSFSLRLPLTLPTNDEYRNGQTEEHRQVDIDEDQ
jgi:hypothetical protein